MAENPHLELVYVQISRFRVYRPLTKTNWSFPRPGYLLSRVLSIFFLVNGVV